MGNARRATVAALACAALVLSFILLPRGEALRPWKAAILLAVRTGDTERSVAAALSRSGLGGIVSASSQEVSVNAFSGMETLDLASLGTRLDEADPRYDDYLKRLPRFFSASGGGRAFSLYYVPTVPGAAARVGRALKGIPVSRDGPSWFFVESRAEGAAWPGIAALAFLAAGFVLIAGKDALKALLPVAVFVPGIFIGGSAYAVPALCSAYAVSSIALMRFRYPYEPGIFGEKFLKALLDSGPGKIMAASLLSAFFISLSVPAAALSIVASILALALIADAGDEWRNARSAHGLFAPLPLRGRTSGAWCSFRPARIIPAIAPAIACVSLLLSPTSAQGSLLSIPHPRRYTPETRLADAGPPTFQDYLEHMSFQERFGKTRLDRREPGLMNSGGGYERVGIGPSGFAREEGERAEDGEVDPPRLGVERFVKAEGKGVSVEEGPWPVSGGTPGAKGGSAGASALAASLALLSGILAAASGRKPRRAL